MRKTAETDPSKEPVSRPGEATETGPTGGSDRMTAGRLSRAAAFKLKEINVLLVAMEGLVKDLLYMLINDKFGEVRDTSSAAKGLELFGKRKFDLVVVDDRLPDLNRAGFLTDIRKGDLGAAVALIGKKIDGAASDPAIIRADALVGFPLDMDRLASIFYKAVYGRKGIK